MKYNARLPFPISIKRILIRDNKLCGICGEKVERWEASRDHIIPFVFGGPNTEDNIQLAHQLCNSLKEQFLESINQC